MIEYLLNSPRLLHQTAGQEELPEPPIAGCIDTSGDIICLSQEGRAIVVNKKSVRELIQLLRMLEKESP